MISGINNMKIIPACALIIVGLLIGTMFTSIVQNDDESNERLILYNEQLQEIIEELENELAIAVDINEGLNEVIEEQEVRISLLDEMNDIDDVDDEVIEFADGRRAPIRDAERIENIQDVRNVARQLQKSVIIVNDCYKISKGQRGDFIVGADEQPVKCIEMGTGYFIRSDGCILTNAHVGKLDGRYTEDGKTRDRVIVIEFADGRDAVRAEVVKVLGPNRNDDMSLLKINGRGYTPVKFAKSHPSAGDQVVSVGHPGTLGQWVKTTGEFEFKTSNNDYAFLIPIGSGASGSPIVNMDGELLGMHKATVIKLFSPFGPRDNNIINIQNFGVEHFTRKIKLSDNVFEINSFLDGTRCEL